MKSLPLVALLAACGPASSNQPSASRVSIRDRLKPCTVEGVREQLLCGNYAVWENRETRQGRKIDLGIVVVPVTGKDVARDPVFAFAGGPGAAITSSASDWVESELRAHRDIVLVDQRGTGLSHRLDCKVPKDPRDVQDYFEPTLPPDEVRRCRHALEAIADLTQYTTSAAADDVDEVRAWLGYDQINLTGGSYGTRAAQIYVRRHGDHVRTANLVGFVGLAQYLPLFHARDGKHALDLVFAACARSQPCAAAFPDLAAEHGRVLAMLDRAPGRAMVESDHHRVEVTIPRGIFAEGIRSALYSADSTAVVPYVIHRASQGDFEPFARIVMVGEPHFDATFAFGQHLAVTCAEDVPFVTPSAIEAAIADTYLGDYRIAMQIAACKEWPRTVVPADLHEPLKSPVPMLVLSGPYDPVTPPHWAEQALPYLPHARHVIVPEAHHGSGGLSHPECIQRLSTAFVERGTADGLDTSCTATMLPPPFITDAAAFDAMLKAAAEP